MNKRILSVMVCSLMAASSAVMADDHVTEITVEAQYLSNSVANSIKTPTPVIDVPQSVSIVTADEISARGHNSIEDIVNYTPGVTMSQGEGHRDAVVFRGVRSTADFFIDGARDDVQYYRPLYNLEQVEILRGPNALLFGRGGTGGVLNRVTKKGEIGSDFNTYEAGTDQFGAFSVQIDSNTTLNSETAFRLNAYYSELDGDRDFSDGERTGINPTLRYSPSEATTIDVSYEYIDHQRFIDRGIPTGADNRPVEGLRHVVFGDPNVNTTELEAHIFRLGLEHQISNEWKVNASAHYGDYDKLYQNYYASDFDPDRVPGVGDYVGETEQGTVQLDGYVDTTQRENLILSGNLVGEFDRHTLIVGAEYIDTSSNQDRYNTDWTPDDNSDYDTAWFTLPLSFSQYSNDFTTQLNDNTEVDIEVTSFYIQDEFAVTDQLIVVLGTRLDSFEIDVVDVKAGNAKSSRKDEEVSPRAGLIYKPSDNVSLYASFSETFMPATGEQFAKISTETVNGVKYQLEPDFFENREVGLKWDLPSGVSLTAAYFESEQTKADRDNATGEAIEVRGTEVEGVEIQIQGRLTDSISFQGGLSSQDGETSSGVQPRELPKTTASLWVDNQLTDKLGIAFGMTYQDESLIKDGSALTLPAYTRFDASARYDVSDNMRVKLHLENLTDELYFPHAHSTHQASVGAPLTARLSISGKF
ncbi:MAG: TonB-dependent receptor [Pseudomonadota bacterium]|nr:TonB-dependent receptor [Pseudomonadota bacterium]